LILLAAWTIRQMAMLNFPDGGALNPREYLVTRAAASNLRDFIDDVKDVSRWRANDTYTLNVVADESFKPQLAWYLRDFRNAQFATHPIANDETQALILPIDAPTPANGWISQTFQIESARGAEETASLLRWLIFRDIGALENSNVALWIPQPR
jgi:hypothetical protein